MQNPSRLGQVELFPPSLIEIASGLVRMAKNIAGRWVSQSPRSASPASSVSIATSSIVQLFVNDKKDGTLVAKFHREHSGFLGIHGKTQASLEVFGQISEPLLDMIVITFVYMETIRAQRERCTAAAGAATAQASAFNTVVVAT